MYSVHAAYRWGKNIVKQVYYSMSDDFEQIIRHFAKSSVMSNGPMAFRDHW